jgi:uncharacterized protein (TIGR02391 family)
MYCAGRMGKDKTDYLKGFANVKSTYEALYEFDDEKRYRNWKEQPGDKLISDLEAVLKAKRLTDSHIGRISTLIWDFQSESERDFRDAFVDKEFEINAKLDYPEDLYKEVKRLLASGENEEAVFQAFKFLDSHIQNVLSLPSHQLYGEELINYAFSPSSGVLQLNTHQNEQVGLRNFFSGANAFLRNPTAHRFMQYDDFDAEAIVAMVAMMARVVSKLADKNLKQSKNDISSSQ